jgi:hypothetical protein
MYVQKVQKHYEDKKKFNDVLVGFQELTRGALNVLTESVVALGRITGGFELAGRAADTHIFRNMLILLRICTAKSGTKAKNGYSKMAHGTKTC